MIHGLGCASSFEYSHVATFPALRARRCILVDLLGFGFSDQPADFGYRVEDHALQLMRFVEARGLWSFDLYGHSMRGSVAIEMEGLSGGRVGVASAEVVDFSAGAGV